MTDAYHDSGKILREVLEVGFGTWRKRFALLLEALDQVLGEFEGVCG